MSDCKDHKHPIQRPGTSQKDRIIASLQPDSAPMHEWEMEDFLRFAYEYARHVRFFDLKSDKLPKGNWQAFFDTFREDEALEKFVKDIQNDQGSITPHLALFVAFLLLLKHNQDHLNKFTGKHLNFYYKKVLNLKSKVPVGDQVHIVFEIAKNAITEKVPKDTELNGGKDDSGKLRYYKTTDELVVNPAVIGKIRNILHVPDALEEDGLKAGLYHAVNANKADGLEAEPEDGLWSAFGHDKLTPPEIGLTIASPLLQLKEGDRWIQLHMGVDTSLATSDDTGPSYDAAELNRYLEVYLTGEKGWLGPFDVYAGVLPDVGENVGVAIEVSTMDNSKLHLLVNIPISVDPIVPLDPKVITDPIQTGYPAAKIVFKWNQESEADSAGVFNLYEQWRLIKVNTIYLDAWVVGMKELVVENDLGPLDPAKAFFPFGSQPSVGSNLFVGNHEIFEKNWQKINVNVTWKDLPSDGSKTDLPGRYEAYRKDHLTNLTKDKYTVKSESTYTDPSDLFENADGGLIVKDNNYFTAGISILDDKAWKQLDGLNADEANFNLFTNQSDQRFEITRKGASSTPADEGAETAASSSGSGVAVGLVSWGIPYIYYSPVVDTYSQSVTQSYTVGNHNTAFNLELFNVSGVKSTSTAQNLNTGQQKGFIKFSLKNHFFHRQYPNIYAVAVSKEASPQVLIPNEPYTPQVEAITIDYFATTRFDTGSALEVQAVKFGTSEEDKKKILQSYSQDNVQLFHQGPFGFARQHAFLKDQALRMHTPNKLEFREVTDNLIRLAPDFYEVGQFMIGIQNINVNQTVSILFQVAEGSENPVLDPFTKEDQIEWHVLSNNEWIHLNRNYVLEDATNNLLQSGIIRFLIPKEATSFNNWLDAGYIWLRATLKKHPDRVAKMIALHTNAVKAQFVDQGNDLKHLETALNAGTITKMINRLARIKKVSQPYASFDEKPAEKQPDYYKRVSERLRHKQRAVTLWDYEQLVLEEFPEIHKVKNLNHTRYNDETDKVMEFSPGDVTLVIVPDLRNKNFYDPLQPRVSQNLLSQINAFLKPLHGMHVNFRAINPHYEKVAFEVEVVFFQGKDPVIYLRQLQNDLISFLSPWVIDPDKGIQFGGTVYKSQVITFIEALNYIDYITDFAMLHDEVLVDGGIIETTSPASILVSAPEHKVKNIIPEVCPS